MIEPVVLKLLATSGMAESTVVDDIGARKPQKDTTQVIMDLRYGGIRSYMESSDVGTGGMSTIGMSCAT
jgi:hypothetical protein